MTVNESTMVIRVVLGLEVGVGVIDSLSTLVRSDDGVGFSSCLEI